MLVCIALRRSSIGKRHLGMWGVCMGNTTDAVDAAISSAVQRQMVSDVPVGAFLSVGGEWNGTLNLFIKAGDYSYRDNFRPR